MIPQENLDASSSAPGLVLEAHEEVEDLPDGATPVEIVAGLDERRRSAAPFPIGVDEVGGLENSDEGIPCAVHVADRDGSTRG